MNLMVKVAFFIFLSINSLPTMAQQNQAIPANFQTENLIAWCVVPFDATKRGPQERARMLDSLGLRHLAYDWREEHVASWDAEVAALKDHSIELSAFWCTSSLEPVKENQRILSLLKKHQLRKTDLWIMLPEWELAKIQDEKKRLKTAVQIIDSLAAAAQEIGCNVGVYNHGGWSGKPSTLLSIMQSCKQKNVGVIYNLHHAHEDLEDFALVVNELRPYLLCLNLNGTTVGGPKIQPIGSGAEDSKLISLILDSKYAGPVGILDHINEQDAKLSLEANLNGLKELLSAVSASP